MTTNITTELTAVRKQHANRASFNPNYELLILFFTLYPLQHEALSHPKTHFKGVTTISHLKLEGSN